MNYGAVSIWTEFCFRFRFEDSTRMWTGLTWPRTNPVSCPSRLLSPTSIQWPLSRTYSTSCNSKMGVAEITKVEEEQKKKYTHKNCIIVEYRVGSKPGVSNTASVLSEALPGLLEPSPSQSYPRIQVTASPQAGTRLKKDKEKPSTKKARRT